MDVDFKRFEYLATNKGLVKMKTAFLLQNVIRNLPATRQSDTIAPKTGGVITLKAI